MANRTEPKPEISPNGHVVPGLIIRRTDQWTTIEGGPYAGGRFRFWVNHPNSLWNQAMFGPTREERDKAYAAIFLEHDHWGEEGPDGNFVEYPPMADWARFVEAIPQGLLEAMVGQAGWGRAELPNSMRRGSPPSDKS